MPTHRHPSPRIRRAASGDARALVELQRAFYVEDRLTHHPANSRALRRLLRTPEAGAVWLIEARDDQGATPVGYVVLTLGWSLELGGRDAFIDELYVRPEHRGHGLGRLALATAEAGARRRGVRALHLEVDASNETARRLYERTGFRLRRRYQLMMKRLDRALERGADYRG